MYVPPENFRNHGLMMKLREPCETVGPNWRRSSVLPMPAVRDDELVGRRTRTEEARERAELRGRRAGRDRLVGGVREEHEPDLRRPIGPRSEQAQGLRNLVVDEVRDAGGDVEDDDRGLPARE